MAYHPSPDAARRRYETHNNQPNDPDYQAFFQPLLQALLAKSSAPAQVLDYGSGSGSPLPFMLKGLGYEVAVYDPLFKPDSGPLAGTYDIVTCTETMEHFGEAGAEMRKALDLLKPRGILALMSLWLQESQDFHTWWYKNDPTHISFYSPRTLAWMAQAWNLELQILGTRMAFFISGSRPAEGGPRLD